MENTRSTSFSGEYHFLSSFYYHAIEIDGEIYPTNEHAFQALKTDDPDERKKVREAVSPATAGLPILSCVRNCWQLEARVDRRKYVGGPLLGLHCWAERSVRWSK